MNTSALKAFAPAVRKQLMEAVSIKLDFALSATTPDYLATYASQVRALRELATADRKGLVERVAYTWFNRLAALRYLDARNWHPFHARVLMAASAVDTLPELFTMGRTGAVPEELRRYVDVVRMVSILQGRIPSADPQGEAYRMLVLGACRFYHGLLPDVFERLDDETELLLPDDLLTQQSVAQGFRTEITDEDCEQVEVLGWLYQFYISEKKDQVMARKAAVPAEDIPAVTQLFTPHWIVRYLVENSLGRLWLLNHPNSLLRAWMPYYVEAEPEVEFLRIERPQEIRLCDPAAGSGHMLTYAFDLLYVIYEEEGYAPSEIPGMILQNNLHGLEIDGRAAQLAALALTLKAREKATRFFEQDHFVQPKVIELKNVHFSQGELEGYSEALQLGGLFTPGLIELLNQFDETKTFGSLIEPCLLEQEITFARGILLARDLGSNLFLHETHLKVLRLLEQAELLTQRYHAVIANPPYMGAKFYSASLKGFVAKHFEDGKADLYGAFVIRNLALCLPRGTVAMITIPNWMFLSSFSQLRQRLTSSATVVSLVHNGRGVWGSDFGSCSFVIGNNRVVGSLGAFRRLFDKPGSVSTSAELEARFFSVPTYYAATRDFEVLPGQVFAYWISSEEREAFRIYPPLSSIAQPRQGLATADDGRFLRFWHETSFDKIGRGFGSAEQADASRKKWFPFSKGGAFRRWYGNNDYVVNWESDGNEIKAFRPRSVVRNEEAYFKANITWSLISISSPSFRLSDTGFIIGHKGPGIYTAGSLSCLLAFLNSSVATNFLSILSPAVGFEIGQIRDLPAAEGGDEVQGLAEELIAIHRRDWNYLETSWDYDGHPLLNAQFKSETIAASWTLWQSYSIDTIAHARKLETENNRLFIRAYKLDNVIKAEVHESQVTLARADRCTDMANFLSYAIGCMMGRYSLDGRGLILADAGDGMPEFMAKLRRAETELTFTPDADGVIPVLDDDWFADDVVARTREFLRVTFGQATLRDNIRFIEDSIGRDLRSYFQTDFYKDHLQTYKKRPIYWMVQSPRKGFSVLIYLHRYTRDTMNVILNRYLRDFQVKLRSRIDHLAAVQTSASTSVREKTVARKESDKLTRTLHECQEWERQTILPLAQARIELDLDDGVKVNYLKLSEALAPIPGLAAAED